MTTSSPTQRQPAATPHTPAATRPPRSVPSRNPERADRCAEGIRDVSEDLSVLTGSLLHSTHTSPLINADVIDRLVEIRAVLEAGIAAAVVRQRSEGKPLGELARAVGVTEDRMRKKYDPQATVTMLATRRRARRVPTPEEAALQLNPRYARRHPRQRLACALTRAHKETRGSQRSLATRLNIDPSYVSLMLSGKRDVSWMHFTQITQHCGISAHLLKPLWDAATGVRPPSAASIRYLRTYLRALHYAAGSPSTETILAYSQNTLTRAEVHHALEGPGAPPWPVVEQLTLALFGLPETALPLWRLAHASAEFTTIPTQAFG